MDGRTAATSLSALVFASCVGACAAAPAVAEDLAAIDEVRKEHVRGVNGTDTDLVFHGMATDVVYLGPGMNPLLGATALRAFIEPLYRQIRPNIVMTPKDVQVVGDVAYEWGVITGHVETSDTPPSTINAKYVFVYRRQPDGSWRIVYDIYNDNDIATTQ